MAHSHRVKGYDFSTLSRRYMDLIITCTAIRRFQTLADMHCRCCEGQSVPMIVNLLLLAVLLLLTYVCCI